MNFDTAQRTYDAMLPIDPPEPRRSNQWIDDKVDELLASTNYWELASQYDLDLEQVDGLHVDEAALESVRMLHYGDKKAAEDLMERVRAEIRRALWWAVNYKINMGDLK